MDHPARTGYRDHCLADDVGARTIAASTSCLHSPPSLVLACALEGNPATAVEI